jgi:hypothetical protein
MDLIVVLTHFSSSAMISFNIRHPPAKGSDILKHHLPQAK